MVENCLCVLLSEKKVCVFGYFTGFSGARAQKTGGKKKSLGVLILHCFQRPRPRAFCVSEHVVSSCHAAFAEKVGGEGSVRAQGAFGGGGREGHLGAAQPSLEPAPDFTHTAFISTQGNSVLCELRFLEAAKRKLS